MQISQEVVDAAHCDQFAATRGLHGLHGFSIGHQRFEWKSALGHRPHKQHAEGVGKSETGCGIDGRGLFLHTSVNSGADYGVGGHRSLPSYVVSIIQKFGIESTPWATDEPETPVQCSEDPLPRIPAISTR